MLLILIKGRDAAFFLSLQNLQQYRGIFEGTEIKGIPPLRSHIPHRRLGF
jgi:hypothetical protein